MMNIPDSLLAIMRDLARDGRRPLLAGGAVRDILMGNNPNDFDVVVLGGMSDVLRRGVPVTQADGHQIIEFRDEGFQFSLIRDLRDDARARDFTINSMFFDPSTDEFVDFFGGQVDLANGTLRHTSGLFMNDPLRILRGARFIGRYGFHFARETAEYLRDRTNAFHFALNDPNQMFRVFNEFSRIVTSARPDLAMQALLSVNALPSMLADMSGVPQSPIHHPEGDVFTHTCFVMNEAVRIMRRDNLSFDDAVVLGLAAMLHDTGKVSTTVNDNGITAHGHEDVSAELARGFLTQYGAPNNVTERVVAMVACHMRIDVRTPRGVRRLAVAVAPSSITELGRLVEADSSGRPPLPTGMPIEFMRIQELAANLNVSSSAPTPILMGRHLISELGMTPSPQFGAILSSVFQAQLDGDVTDLDGALQLARALAAL